jgi:hypothetical protein
MAELRGRARRPGIRGAGTAILPRHFSVAASCFVPTAATRLSTLAVVPGACSAAAWTCRHPQGT